MQLADLTAYAERQYHICEDHKWSDFPGFSVLADPATGKWLALLMRQWDTETGTEIELCDLKCGQEALLTEASPALSRPYRMRGVNWVGVRFTEETDSALVLRLFDRAVRGEAWHGYTLVLENRQSAAPSAWQDTPLPPAGERPRADAGPIPERLRQMRRLCGYSESSFLQKCKNFYTQAKFMEDYEDDVPWRGSFQQYYPSYRDLRTEQLRGYFTWRAAVRRGEYGAVPTSLVYLYLYELLNGIGADSVEDSLKKLRDFERGYLDTGLGEESIRRNLRRWMLELAVVKGLPPEAVRDCADPAQMERDDALSVLRQVKEHSSAELSEALLALAGGRFRSSPALAADAGRELLGAVWRLASAEYRENGKTLFTACFGEKRSSRWHPLENALYYSQDPPAPRDCVLSPARRYSFRDGVWREQSYQKLHFDKKKLESLLRETDRRLRLYLKTGRPLQERPEDAWAAPFIEAVLAADRAARRAQERPRITIRFDDLEQIRRDAVQTRESLLTEEDKRESEAALPQPSVPEPQSEAPVLPLEAEQIELLRMLLRGESARAWIAQRHLMASVAADALNEALFDELGDAAVDCDGTEITLVEDYREEIARLLGGETE